MTDLTLGYFLSIWAILSFLLIFVPVFMLLPKILSTLHNILWPIASVRVAAPIALLITLIIAFFMFTMRDDLHDYSQSITFKEKKGIPLPIYALVLFAIAIVLIFFLGFAITTQEQLVTMPGAMTPQIRGQLVYGSTGHLVLAFLMTGCLVGIFASLGLALGLLAVYDFGLYAEQRTPNPIYLNEQLMLDVVMRAVKHQLDPGVELRLSEMVRLSDAGMKLLLHHSGKLVTEGNVTLLEEKGWLVEADLWARMTQMVEQHPRSIQVKRELPPDTVPAEGAALVPTRAASQGA
jgi:hypothetical protein